MKIVPVIAKTVDGERFSYNVIFDKGTVQKRIIDYPSRTIAPEDETERKFFETREELDAAMSALMHICNDNRAAGMRNWFPYTKVGADGLTYQLFQPVTNRVSEAQASLI